jgi:hypothetical protein
MFALTSCVADHWTLFGQLLKAYVDLLEVVAQSVLEVCRNTSPTEFLPAINVVALNDSGYANLLPRFHHYWLIIHHISRSAYSTLTTWLNAPSLRKVASQWLSELADQKRAGKGF